MSAQLTGSILVLLLVGWGAARVASLLWRRVMPALQTVGLLAGRHGFALSLTLMLGAAGTFLMILYAVVSSAAIVHVDLAVFQFLQGLRTASADRWMVWISQMGSVGVLTPLTVAVMTFLLWQRQRTIAAYWVATVVLGELFVQALKYGVARARPLALYTGNEQYSFPSGHVSMTTIVMAALAVLLARSASARQRAVIGAGVGIYVALVALSRLYLGAHWFSDVAGGVLLGTAWVSLTSLVLARLIGCDQVPLRPLAWTAALAIVVSGTAWSQWRGPDDAGRYADHPGPRGTMDAMLWASQGWQSLPQMREEIAGEREETFTVQVSCSERQLPSFLAASGWQRASPWTAQSALRLLASGAQTMDPVLPKFHAGVASQLQFVMSKTNGRSVLQLWRAPIDIRTAAGTHPLWYGIVDRGTDGGWLARRREYEVSVKQLQTVLPTATLRQAGARQALLLQCPANFEPG